MASLSQFEVLLEMRESERDAVEAKLAEELASLERRREFVRSKRDAIASTKRVIQTAKDRRAVLLESTAFRPRELARMDRHLGDLETRMARQSEQLERARSSVAEQERRCAEVRRELAEAQKALTAVEKQYERGLEMRERVEERKRAARSDDVAARKWWEENR